MVLEGTSVDFRHQIETMKTLYRLHLSAQNITHYLHRRRYLLKPRYILRRQGKALLSWNLNSRHVSTRTNHWTLHSTSWFHLRLLLCDSVNIFFFNSYLTHACCISSPSNPLLFSHFNNIVTYTMFTRDDNNGSGLDESIYWTLTSSSYKEYNTPKITVIVTHKLKSSTTACLAVAWQQILAG
jgi:hypothetical protein